MAKTPEQAMAAMVQNLEAKTGRSLDQWLRIAKSSKHSTHGELVKFLKAEHGIGHGYANMIAHQLFQSSAAQADADDLVEAQYAGTKAGLRPVYEALVRMVKDFGGDVEISPKKAYVSLRRGKQFGLIQPSTATRLDVGIHLKGVPAGKRLEASGSFNAMVSHRVRLADLKEVDAELESWLRQAYESA